MAFQNRMMRTSNNPFRMSNPERYHGLNYVKVMVIKKLLPFNLMEDEQVRSFFHDIGSISEFPTKALYSRKVKCHIVELYCATKASTMKKIAAVQEAAILPPFSLSIDLWKCKITGDKYLGVRLSWVDPKSKKAESPLLGVKRYDPPSEARDSFEYASDVIAIWTKEVLTEFGVKLDMLCASVSDRGSDIKRTCTTTIGTDWEYCMCHMINCSIVFAFGLYTDANKAKESNPQAFKVITAVKKVLGRFKQSYHDKTKLNENQELKDDGVGAPKRLAALAITRWSSILTVLQSVLSEWEAMRAVYRLKREAFPLTQFENDLVQMHALLFPLIDIIKMA